jgi:predicted DNA-binding mobile mystery protein A
MRNDEPIRMQLDGLLNYVKLLSHAIRPTCGWIITIRNALGMTSVQFAKRMNVSQARSSAIENGEIEDSLTLKTVKEAASALNCRFVYFLIPEKTLEETVKDQSIKFIMRNTESIFNSIGLENNSTSSAYYDNLVKIKVEEVLQKHLNKIWDIE